MSTVAGNPAGRGVGTRSRVLSGARLDTDDLITVGLVLLIPVLVAVGPMVAAMIIRAHVESRPAASAGLVLTAIIAGGLFLAAVAAFAVAWQRRAVVAQAVRRRAGRV